MAKNSNDEWLNLSEAARFLGVHPSTVRLWADKGDIPTQRTSGGHRRFRRVDLDGWAASRRRGTSPGAVLMVQAAMGRARMEMTEGQLSRLPWFSKMSETARAAHRDASHKLLGLLKRYLAAAIPEERELLLGQARQMGRDYFRLSRESQLTLSESLRAFLYFRDFLTESVMQLAEASSPNQPESLADLYRHTAQFTNEVLVALVAAFEIR